MSPSVAFIQRRVPHYREAFFVGLYDKLREHGVALDVIVAGAGPDCSSALALERPPWLSSVRARRLAIGGRELIWQDVLRATAAHDLIVAELAARIVSNLGLIARSRAGGPTVGGFGHGRNFARRRIPGPSSGYARLARSVDWWFAYNDRSADAVRALGFPAARITAINNTIDTTALAEAVTVHRRAGVDELRRTLGIAGTPVAVFCGSLYAGKRLDFLFDAALRLRRRFPELQLVVLGDGPREGAVRAFSHAHGWVHYFGRVVGVERAKYLAVADVMLNPGLVGLVVLDSFAAGVPLITTNTPVHSPEIQYLRHAENGWCSANTLDAYVDAVALILGDRDVREHLRRGCAVAADCYPMSGMVDRFAEGILCALAERRATRSRWRVLRAQL